MNYAQLQQSWPEFNQRITHFLHQLGLADLSLKCDHCALRVNSKEKAELLVDAFEQAGQVISNNMINGRPILIIKLHTPMQLNGASVPCVELPFPSDKVYPQEGWEHIELVLPTTATTCEALISDLSRKVPSITDIIEGKTDIKVKLSSPQGDNERLANPTIAFKKDGICIKVHPHSIETIIASEQ
ncbi:VOC family protein [Shewanella sp. WPAGA9]|uniref:VOC family protein n=1 Tax=Shewanella sp. ENK2 TaxID=2775245 RepID=UPI0017876D8B|nr:VOC family protein [Shewanella sp. WPAGA9]